MTTVLDFNALQSGQGLRVSLLGNQQVGAGLTGSDYSDFSVFASVYFDVEVQRVSTGAPGSSLTVTIEHSSDGSSWVTAGTPFTFTGDGTQAALLVSPKAHIRARASGSGAEWYVRTVTASPTYLDAALGGFLSALDSNQYAIVACVIRNDGAGWYMLLDDTQHHPLNVDSITNDTNQIVIDYTSHGFSETVGFYAVVDETLAQYGFSIGASVTAATATLKIGQQRTLGADIGWNGAAFVVNNQNADPTGHFAIGSYSGGDLHITHDDIGASSKSNITLVSRGDTYTAMVPNDNGVTNTDFFAAFYTPGSGGWTKQTVAATGMRFYVTRTASQHVNPNNITTVLYPNSDFWCFGVFKR